MEQPRIVFMGTPDLAATCLAALLREPTFQLIGVVSQPDRPKGRDLKLVPTPVKALAEQHGLPVLQPQRARDEAFLAALAEWRPDLIAVAAFGQILPQRLLDVPKFGCLNVHTSILPRWRGASPIQSALLHGDTETGVTIMRMEAGLDTGPILSTVSTPITAEDNGQTLHDRLAQLGGELLIRTIPDYVAGRLTPQSQPEAGVTYAAKIKKQDGALDWTQPAVSLWNRLRAFTPWPGAFTQLTVGGKKTLLKLWAAEPTTETGVPGTILSADKSGITVACGDGALRIHTLQREGSRRMNAAEFLAGCPLAPGSILG